MENKQNDNIKNIKFLDKEQFADLLGKAKKYFGIVVKFLGSNQNDMKLVGFLSILTFVFFVYSGLSLYSAINNSNKNIYELESLNKYDTQLLKSNPDTKDIANTMTNIKEIIQDNDDIKSEIQRYLDYKDNLQLSYNNFLQYILLPKLNIRKKLYTDELELNILGKNYLDQNPYNDINLLQKWTDFFASTDNNQLNNIKDMNISNIKEIDNGLFSMDIDFSFITPSRAGLLFLTDKLTMTSDKNNIGLLGEFFYYLRQQIKLQKDSEIKQLQKKSVFSGDNNIDRLIGYEIYQRAFQDKETDLIDEGLINALVNSMMECKQSSQEECYYRFRDKYRNISSLAYTIGIESNDHKKVSLKNFIKNIPPLMAVKEFNFDKIASQSLIQEKNTKYQGQVKLEVYGKNISEDDIKEIANSLGKKCFVEEKELTIQLALDVINNIIKSRGNVLDEKKVKTSNIQTLKDVIEKINIEYPDLGNYKKTIRLFEVYRMLNENGLCENI